MASVSSSQAGTVTISAEFGYLPRTPASERSWRHWSIRSSAQKSPVTVSEGRSHFFGSFRARGFSQGHSASENGSPTKLERRKSIAELFNGIPSSKKHKERTWSFSGKTTRLRSASPRKESVLIEEPTTPSKRRKSISNLFGASLRGHASTSNLPERQSFAHKNQFGLASPHDQQSTNNERREERHVSVVTPNVVETIPTYRISPTPRVQFAISDASDDPFEEPPKATVISVKEVKPSAEERRICSASTATWASNAPTLVPESSEANGARYYSEDDRPRTPDSYLQSLIEACGCPSEVSSTSQGRLSSTPSLAKHHVAAQPLDFLADEYKTLLNGSKSQKRGPLDFESSPSPSLNLGIRNAGLQQNHITRRLPLSLDEGEIWPSTYKRINEDSLKRNDQELAWDVGDIDTNFRRRLQERNERYRSLEPASDREYIARSIKATVAKMTKNFYLDRSSDEQTPMIDGRIAFRDVIPFDKYIGPQKGRSYQFGLDDEDVQDSISRGSLIMQEIQKKPFSHRDFAHRIPSPVTKAKPASVVDRVLENSLKFRATLEPIRDENKHSVAAAFQDFVQDGKSARGNIRTTRPSSSDEAIHVVDFMQLAEDWVRKLPARKDGAYIYSNQPRGFQKQDLSRPGDCISRDIGEEPASSAVDSATQTTDETEHDGDSNTEASKCEAVLRHQADPAWLQESLGIRSICQQVPPFSRLVGGNEIRIDRISPAPVMEPTLEESAGLRTLEDHTSQQQSRYEPITISKTVSNSRQRRVVSTAAVHVQFPATKHDAQPETFDNKSKAVAALYDYKLGPLSNFVVYDPVKRILHAQHLDSPPPDPAELEKSGLELVWLPLQPNSSFQVVATEICEEGSAEPAVQSERHSVISAARNQEDASVQYLTTRNTLSINFSSSDSESSGSNCGVEEGNFIRPPPERSAEAQAVSDSKRRTLEWTTSDEEYVIEVDSDTARSYLGSQYSDSVCSTPKLESGTLLYPDLPRILLDGQEIMDKDDHETSLRGTKTWPQLGREFKAKHPELFRSSSKLMIEEQLLNRDASDADSESSFDSECSLWSTKVEVSSNPVPKVPKMNKGDDWAHEEHEETRLSQLVVVQSRIGPSDTICVSSNNMPSVEHIENVNNDEFNTTRLHKDIDDLTRTLGKSNVDGGSDQESTPGDRGLYESSPGRVENQTASLSTETCILLESWAEAERTQAGLYQPNPSDQSPENRPRSPSPLTLRITGTLEEANGSSVCKPISRQEFARSNSVPGPGNARTQSSLITSTPITSWSRGLPFTSHGERMLCESDMSMDSGKRDGTPDAKASLQVENHDQNSPTGKGGVIQDLASNDEESPTSQTKASSNCISGFAAPSRIRMAEKSGLLKDVDQARDLSSVTLEDLNLRLVGKAARQSELAKTSKVSTLVDIFKARGLMSSTLKPVIHTTTTSPGLKTQPGRRPTAPSTRILTPSGNIYRPSENVEYVNMTEFPQTLRPVKRVPNPAMTDADTELDDEFGEELVRVEKHFREFETTSNTG